MIDDGIADELDALARAINNMRPPQNHRPEAFHEDRSELASKARSIAARLRSGPVAKPSIEIKPAPAPIGRQSTTHEVRHVEGRTVMVLTRRQASDHGFY